MKKPLQKQSDRLKFIDFRLMFCGFLNRSDVVSHFNIASTAATRDLAAYSQVSPENLHYDTKKKLYLKTESFSPMFEHNSLDALTYFTKQNATNFISKPDVRCESLPQIDRVPLDILAIITQAISQGRALEVTYYSLSSGKKSRIIVPHCLVDNGLRWHIRAYDRKNSRFSDFVVARIDDAKLAERISDVSHERQQEDRLWNRFVELEIVPHPNLENTEVIEYEYQMIDGSLCIEVRAAVAGYLLRRWNVDISADHSLEGDVYQLWLKNRIALYKVDNLKIAPGYKEGEGIDG